MKYSFEITKWKRVAVAALAAIQLMAVAQRGWAFYNPQTGRWLNREPLGETVSPNAMGYVDNDPVNAYDVLGLYNSAGHFYTTYLVARAAGYNNDQAFQFAYWSQYPDQNMDFEAIHNAVKLNFAVEKYLHSLMGGDAAKLRRYLACLLKSGQFDPVEMGMLIHALGDAYAHSYKDWNPWVGTPKQGKPNPHYGQDQLFGPPFGHLFSGHMPDYIAGKPGLYGDYVDQLYGVLTGANGGAATHPEWIQQLKDKANAFSKPSFFPDYYNGDPENTLEVDALKNLPGGYNGNYNPDDKHSTLPEMERDIDFREKLLEKIRKGIKGCCPK